MTWALACPACQDVLVPPPDAEAALRCARCGSVWPCVDGIRDFVPSGAPARFERFLAEYAVVRRSEQRGSSDPGWYRRLPDVAATDPLAGQWRIRARSWCYLADKVLPRLGPPPLRVLDVGAGNGWLSYRLAALGHQSAAIDLWVDAADGLGALRRYAAELAIPTWRADYDHLPLRGAAADLVIFNASFHYSPDHAVTLREAMRVLAPGGHVIIMDSPIYRHEASGVAMVAERRAQFAARFGFESNALGSREYLTDASVAALGRQLGLRWQRLTPWYGLAWALRPWQARLRRRRQPASFALLIGQPARMQ